MLYDNRIPPYNQVYKFLYDPSRCVFFPTDQEHKAVAERLDFQPTDAGMIMIAIDHFTLPNKVSMSLGIETDEQGVIGLEAFLGRVYRHDS